MRLLQGAFVFFYVMLLAFPSAADEGGDGDGKVFTISCNYVAQVNSVDKLALFKRIPGVYRIPVSERWRGIAEYGWNSVYIPVGKKYKPKPLGKPFAGIQFIDAKAHISLAIMTVEGYQWRRVLSQYTRRGIYEKFGNTPLFSFLEKSLGVDRDGFCGGGNSEKTVSMFMSTVAWPWATSDDLKVYLLDKPKALLLVGSDTTDNVLRVIFPGKNKDTLGYEYIKAPSSYKNKLVGSLVRIK